MNFFTNNPFTRIVAFWLTGILLCKYIPNSIYLLIPCSLVLLVYSLYLFRKKEYPFDFISSLFIGSCLCLLAFQLSSKQPVTISEKYVGNLKVVLLEKPAEKTNSYQLNVRILQADTLIIENKKAMIYTQKSEKIKNLKAGNQLVCKLKMNRIKNRGNPFEFDYAGYMQKQNYYYNAFLDSSKILILSERLKNPIYLAENFRNKLLELLRIKIQSDKAFQVISALTLGYRKELSIEIKSSFAATGAMHVLAVSGLHVGMIYLFLGQMLAFLKRRKTGKRLFVVLIASILWGYALITGFSPSVQRATVMFSFILIGNSMNRPTSIYNSLAASAFLLLTFTPDLLFEVGFQLSYMAVLSIVFFYPKLEKIFNPKYWITQKIWQLSCVSIAAQLGTFALSIYYFNQFPVYFWLSNLIVIPAAYLILGFTLFTYITLPITMVSNFIGKLLGQITDTTIFLLSKIKNFPHSVIENISISSLQLFSLIVFFCMVIFFIKWKRKAYFFTAMISITLFLSHGLFRKYQLLNQQKIIVYNHHKRVIHLIQNRTNYLLHLENSMPENYLTKNTVTQLQLNKPVFIKISQSGSLTQNDLLIKNGVIQFLNQTFFVGNPKGTIPERNLFPNSIEIEGKRDSSTVLLQANNVSTQQSHSLINNGALVLDFK